MVFSFPWQLMFPLATGDQLVVSDGLPGGRLSGDLKQGNVLSFIALSFLGG